MKKGYYVLLALLFMLTSCSKEEHTPIFDVLLIGSSYTNGYTALLEEITFNCGDSINRFTSSLGNGTIKRHLNEGKTLQYISENKLDYVMIQEAAYMASLRPDELPNGTIPYLKSLIDTIKYYSPETKIGFYMSHAYKTGNTDRCEKDSVVCNYEGMQNRVIMNYNTLAETFNIELAPVGFYWQKFYNEHPEIRLWETDNSHAGKTGNYLTAAIIYSTIYNKKPSKIVYPARSDSAEIEQIHDFIMSIDFNKKEWK